MCKFYYHGNGVHMVAKAIFRIMISCSTVACCWQENKVLDAISNCLTSQLNVIAIL